MKSSSILAILLGISMLGASAAQAYFPAEVVPTVNPREVSLAVENIWGVPVVCRGAFFARTASAPEGVWLNFAIGPVVAGTSGFAYMTPPYVYQGDYFISVPQIRAFCDYI
jgi:hypothetical protein